MPFIKPKQIRIKKAIAVFMLLLISNQILMPSLAYALTAGPTAPEATNFEPVDMTDMVNPLSGGLTYGLPLLEVPGPEGSYPLSLSYHAGIQPNEDASWVGLGWSLNPGAITRNVSGFPDDWSAVSTSSRSYWAGGSRSSYSISVGLCAGPSFGLTFAHDTYLGFGVGASVGYGFNLVKGIGKTSTSIGIGGEVGVDPYGGAYMGINLNMGGQLGNSALNIGGSIGISTNFESVDVDAGAGISLRGKNVQGEDGKSTRGMSKSLLGASISTSGGKVNLSAGGGSIHVINSNAGKIQTRSHSFGIPIPLTFFDIQLGYNYTRYWSDETVNVETFGALSNALPGTNADYADDTYRLLDPEHYNIVDNADPDKLQGGTFPDFDSYSVTAQGLGGSIRPYIFNENLGTQNRPGEIVRNEGGGVAQLPHGIVQVFRFINDFSDSFTQGHSDIDDTFQFDTPIYGNDTGNPADYGNDLGGDVYPAPPPGSKSVSYISNGEINAGGYAAESGFMDVPAGDGGFIRNGKPGALSSNVSGIGGFVITNESGVKYHYALPAYEYNEYSKNAKTDEETTFTEEKKPEPYAYTWYLTAITGPDFVDRNNNGIADDGDWGYWVAFEYGKWTDNYNWRNPAQGWHIDVDPAHKGFSQGTKEVYYLDAIRTRTHTAIFEKELRADSKGISELLQDGSSPGFTPTNSVYCHYTHGDTSNISAHRNNYPAPTLKLKEILLFKNDQLNISINSLRTSGTAYNKSFTYGTGTPCDISKFAIHGENVIDSADVAANPTLISKCLRRIAFNYDYSLCPGAPNSFDPSGTDTYKSSPATPASFLGKLTLLSVDLQGKGGVSVTPPIQFQYDLDPNDPANKGTVEIYSVLSNKTGTIKTTGSNIFKPGDILKLTNGSSTYYCTLLSTTDNVFYNVLYLNGSPSGTFNAVKTKNPPYNNDATDAWGMYKSDYIPIDKNENLSRITTMLSNKSVDVWSLRGIRTSVGSTINMDYEGNTYQRSILSRNKSMVTDGGSTSSDPDDFLLTVPIPNTQDIDLNTIYKVGQKIDGVFLYSRTIHTNIPGNATFNDHKTMVLKNYFPVIKSVTNNGMSSSITIAVSYQYLNDLKSVSNLPYASSVTGVDYTQQTGNIPYSVYGSMPGGGVRVKDLVIDDLSGSVSKTAYNYNMPDHTSEPISSGITSYEPVTLDIDKVYSYASSTNPSDTAAINAYHRYLYEDLQTVITLSRDAPAPGVMYEYATVSDADILPDGTEVPVDGKSMYQYRVFNKGMIGIKEYQYFKGTDADKKNLSIKDYTSQIGNLVRSVQYDTKGNKLSETINHYLNDDIVDQAFDIQADKYEPRLGVYNNQGLMQERYADARDINEGGSTWHTLLTMSGRDQYPIIQTGTTQIDYKNGTSVTQQNLAFDFYSGVATKTLTIDSYGNRFMNEIIPAYHQYPEMGPMYFKESQDRYINKNMLTQEAANYTYAVDASNTPIGVVSATAQTWSVSTPVLDPDGNAVTDGSQSKIWRMESSYNWMKAGTSANDLTPYASFIDFFATGGSSNASWKKTSQITKYNVYSNALEAADINGHYAATRMGYNSSKVLITGGPARYDEIAYAGAEDALLTNGKFSNNISKGDGSVISDSTKSHTGVKALQATNGQKGFTYTVPLTSIDAGKNYSAAVWVKASATDAANTVLRYTVGAGSVKTPAQSYTKSAAGWYLLEMTIPAAEVTGSGNLVVWCENNSASTVYFDDFRFQPTAASAIAYVYDNQTDELTYVIGNNNMYTRYQYDAIGRLVRVYKEVLGKSTIPRIKAIAYNYGREARPTWQNTGTTRCQQVSGVSNGYVDAQQKDLNPLSPTYNQTRWVGTNVISVNCPAGVFYARIELANPTSSDYYAGPPSTALVYGTTENADVYINLYLDPTCTTPYVPLSPVTITVTEGDSIAYQFDDHALDHTDFNPNDVTFNLPSGSSYYYIGNEQLTDYHYHRSSPTATPLLDTYTNLFDAKSNTGYTAESTYQR